jgi:hypothetical protein
MHTDQVGWVIGIRFYPFAIDDRTTYSGGAKVFGHTLLSLVTLLQYYYQQRDNLAN